MVVDSVKPVVIRTALILSILAVAAALVVCWRSTGGIAVMDLLLTPDQQGARLYRAGRFDEAAKVFADPYWRAAALYRAGDFKEAAGVYVGLESPEADYNQGNARVMLGDYESAIKLYDKALAVRPGWEDAEVNRRIAKIRAERLKEKLGAGTGGQLPPDKVVSDKKKNSQSGQQGKAVPMTGAEINALWLRRVQTRPADFLRLKFAYQYAEESK